MDFLKKLKIWITTDLAWKDIFLYGGIVPGCSENERVIARIGNETLLNKEQQEYITKLQNKVGSFDITCNSSEVNLYDYWNE